MDKFLLAYIKQRMREMGICHYHFEPIRFIVGVERVTVNAFNEFYFLTGIPLPGGTSIVSDTNVVITNAISERIIVFGETYAFHPIQEFSGLIEMTFTGGTDFNPNAHLEFIHVVPTCHEDYCVKRTCCNSQEIKK